MAHRRPGVDDQEGLRGFPLLSVQQVKGITASRRDLGRQPLQFHRGLSLVMHLLPNPGLEIIAENGLPEGWKRRDYGNRPANRDAKWETVSGKENVHGQS